VAQNEPQTRAVIATDPFTEDGTALARSLERGLKSALLYCDIVEIANVGPALFPTTDNFDFGFAFEAVNHDTAAAAHGMRVTVPGRRMMRRPTAALLRGKSLNPSSNSADLQRVLAAIDTLSSCGLVQDLGSGLIPGTVLKMGVDITGVSQRFGRDAATSLFSDREFVRFLLWAGFYFEALLTRASFPFLDYPALGPSTRHPLPSRAASREVELLRGMLSGLPFFEHATIDEIVDLRDELRLPLQRFRGALAQAAHEQEVTGDDGWAEAGRELWRREVQPALAEIEQEIEDNRYMRQLVSRADPKGIVAGATGLALGISQLSGVARVITSGAVAASPFVIAARDQWLAKLDIARTNRFFFLHRLQTRAHGVGRRRGLAR
jgi:hypothetical protein